MTRLEADASLYDRTGLCAQCDRAYDKKRTDQRFCGKACAAAWYAAHPHPKKTGAAAVAAHERPPVELVPDPAVDAEKDARPLVDCAGCDVIFEPKRTGQRFHSPGCSGRWHAKQRAAQAAAEKSQPVLAAVPELPTEPAVPLEVPADDPDATTVETTRAVDPPARELQVVLAKLALEAIGAADAWHLEAWCGPGIHLILRKEAT